MGMRRGVSMLLPLPMAVVLLVTVATSVSSLPSLSFPPRVPAFAWSNHRKLDSHRPSAISYQTLSSEDFVGKVKGLFAWQQYEDVVAVQQEEGFDLDVVMVFVGSKLRSGDIARVAGATRESSDTLAVLNRVVTSSNSSVSLPYVALPRDGAGVAEALVKEIVGGVEDGESRLGEVITTESCVNENTPQAKRLSLSGLQEYLPTRMTTRRVGRIDLVVVCGSSELERSRGGSISLSEGETLDEVLWGLDEWSTRYVALYTTDLSGKMALPVRPRGRQLGSVVYEGEEYCNDVCQTKATVLEGLLVGLTLLIILISGLCCMAGITTPSRFEQNKDGQ